MSRKCRQNMFLPCSTSQRNTRSAGLMSAAAYSCRMTATTPASASAASLASSGLRGGCASRITPRALECTPSFSRLRCDVIAPCMK